MKNINNINKISFVGRIGSNSFSSIHTELLHAEGKNFKEIFENIKNQLDEYTGMILEKSEVKVRNYYKDSFTDLNYIEIINESYIDFEEEETKWGKFYIEADGQKQYIRTIDTKTGEITLYTPVK